MRTKQLAAIPFFLTFFFCCLFTPTVHAQPHRFVITKGQDNGRYLDGVAMHLQPGDTLVLRASGNPYTYMAFEHLYGSAAQPIVVINEGGQVQLSAGMAIYNSSFVKISGSGSRDAYGFHIADPNSAGVGVEITKRSSHIEVCRVDIRQKTYGCWVKQEGSCADSLQYPNWVIQDIRIHDNRIVNMHQEGMYLGSTDPNGQRPVNCNGTVIYPRPLRLGNIQVYNNIVDSTNRSGIQLSGADSGNNAIYGNTVSHAGYELNDNQGNGISLGGYTKAHIYNNQVSHTFANGILVLGAGNIVVEHNRVDSSGYLAGHITPGMAGIMVDTRTTEPLVLSAITLAENQLGANTDYAIRFYKTIDSYSRNNILYGNSGTKQMAPGIYWSEQPDGSQVTTSIQTFIPRKRYIALGALLVLLCGTVVLRKRTRQKRLQ